MLAADALIGKLAVVLKTPAGISPSPQTYSKHRQAPAAAVHTLCGNQREESGGFATLFGQCCLDRLTESKTDDCFHFFSLFHI